MMHQHPPVAPVGRGCDAVNIFRLTEVSVFRVRRRRKRTDWKKGRTKTVMTTGAGG